MHNDKDFIYIKSRNMAMAIFWLTKQHYTQEQDRNKEGFIIYRFPNNDRVRRAIGELNHLRNDFDNELN